MHNTPIRLPACISAYRFVQLSTTAKCHLCSVPLFTWNFYVFSCQHYFHAKCLLAHVMKEFLSAPMQQRVITLQEWSSKTQEAIQERRKTTSGSNKALMDASGNGDTSSQIEMSADPSGGILGKRVFSRAPLAEDSLSGLMDLKKQLKEDLDDIIASECLFCGDYIVRTVDMPFVRGVEEESWSIGK